MFSAKIYEGVIWYVFLSKMNDLRLNSHRMVGEFTQILIAFSSENRSFYKENYMIFLFGVLEKSMMILTLIQLRRFEIVGTK